MVPDPLAVIEAVAAHYADAAQDRLDGLTVDLGSDAADPGGSTCVRPTPSPCCG